MRFRKGQVVTWSPEWRNVLDLIGARRHGHGPFRVVKTEAVVNAGCTCQDRLFGHESDCPSQARQRAGHPQYVTIQTPIGEHTYSGAYFQAAMTPAT